MDSKRPMRRGRRLALSAGVVFTFCMVASAAAQQAPVPARANPPVFFAQTRSDLAPDPAARTGTLANGMTYVIYKNATPPGTASVFMRIDAGSLMEQEYQRGLAHFIEHMAFNGSKNVPEGEMVKLLERDGLSFGADTNAFTSQTETVYTLNLPTVAASVIDDSLFLMREVASNQSLDPGAIDRERGVVLGEERVRAGPSSRAMEAALKDTFPGQKYADRMPIGLTDVIRNAPPKALADFYRDFYRPEYTTLIVVGDIDPDVIEAKIKARFADWKASPQSANALTDFGAYRTKGELIRAYADKGLIETFDLTWVRPSLEEVETRRKDIDDTLDSFAHIILNERFARQAKLPATAFRAASFGKQTIRHTARATTLAIYPKPGQEAAAFDQAVTMFRQFRANGVTQSEVDRVLLNRHRAMELSAKAARTRSNGSIAAAFIASLGSASVVRSPAQDLAEYTQFEPELTLAAINARILTEPLGDGPIVSAQGEDLHGFDRTALTNAYHVAMAKAVPAYVPHPVATWPYTRFGTPSAVVQRTTLPDLGATRVTFANGVVLNVKQTNFDDQAVDVSVLFAGGFRGIPRDKGTTMMAANRLGLFDGGLGKLRSEDIGEALTGKRFTLGFAIAENAAGLGGGTDRDDLATQLQVMAAFVTDAAFRPEAMDRLKARLRNFYIGLKSEPDGVFGYEVGRLVHGGDPRYFTPAEQDFMAVGNDEVAAMDRMILGTAPIEVTIVGDIGVDDAIAQVDATFGSLPRRAAPTALPPLADADRFPTNDLRHVFVHDGRDDQNVSAVIWPTTGFYSDQQRASVMELLAAVMTLRELHEIRERQGASYGVSASSVMSGVYPDFGYITTRAGVRPDGDATFYDTVARIADDFKKAPVSDDELARARRPIIDRLQNARHTNGYWMSILSGSTLDPREVDAALSRERRLAAVTPADIQRVAATYLDMAKALRIQVKPDLAKGK